MVGKECLEAVPRGKAQVQDMIQSEIVVCNMSHLPVVPKVSLS